MPTTSGNEPFVFRWLRRPALRPASTRTHDVAMVALAFKSATMTTPSRSV